MLPGLTLGPGDFSPDNARTLLCEHGLFCFERVDQTELLQTLHALGTPLLHPDSNVDGLTLIAGSVQAADALNAGGFSDQALPPHTDRTILERPPEIVALWCEQPSPSGGDTVLLDGRVLYRDLADSSPELARLLENPRNVVFAAGDDVRFAPVFERTSAGRVRIRWRFDQLLYVNPSLWRWMEHLQQTITARSLQFRMAAGQGYVLQNTRWLHGRTAFSGPRAFHRLLLHVGKELEALGGFLP